MFRKLARLGRSRSDGDGQLMTLETQSTRRGSSPIPPGASGPLREQSTGLVDQDPSLQRSPTTTTIGSGSQSLQMNSEVDARSLGLKVVYTPDYGHKVDIIFLHGLGGTSRSTWSKSKDPDLFWPLTFLPLEPDICLARILTFGYNASFRKAGNVSISMLDFAKDLLFDLKYGQDEQKEDLKMGNVPLIFVVHSMGGLIVKEAYMQGQNDPDYAAIIKAVTAIAFLATPHRGTNMAQTLNRILQSTMITNSKQYIAELAKNSLTLQKLNEQFRHIAPKLDIVSFYETQPTSIGLKNTRAMVLEKDSSVLGYPGETSKGLDADHHGICKYDSPGDPNYIAVRNIVKSLVSKIISKSRSSRPALSSRRDSHDLKEVLSITELPTVDYSFFRDQWTQGTSEWILQEKAYLEWRHAPESTPRLLWLNGGPASGKSVMSSYIINTLVEDGASCQYFFIRFGDRKKRTLSLLLRSIAYQIAQSLPEFLARVVELIGEAAQFETADPRVVWERIFRSMLFTMEERQPLFWVIDGIDEADDPRAVIRLLSDLSSSNFPIRILLVGRRTSDTEAHFQKVPQALKPDSISIHGHQEDLRSYIYQELSISGSDEFKENIVRQIVNGAQNNFLWVRLAVDKVNSCHRHAEVLTALQQLPVGMEALYDRMASSIAQHQSSADRELAATILQYITCSLRVLTVAELSQALGEDVSGMMDLQRSIIDLCCGFVVIDNSGNVAMIHQTAREYLLGGDERPFHIDKNVAHKQILSSCMRCLMTMGLRGKISRNQKPEFLDYAAMAWSSHLTSITPGCSETGESLKKFLTGPWVLTWIEVLAANQQLRILVQTSKNLSRYSIKRKAHHEARSEEGHHIGELEIFESWAVDLVKVAGRFGNILRRRPESIYKLIPPFCPQNSSIYQLFGKTETKSLMVSGLTGQTWDDSLARISLGEGAFASSISAAGAQVAVLVSSGSVFIYDSSTFEESTASPIRHGERVYMFELNSAGTLLATYGYRTTKVWEISTGNCNFSIANIDSRPRPLAMLFTKNNTTLLVGADDRQIRSVDLKQSSATWQTLAELEEPELDGHFLNASNYMALNKDGSLVAVAYRGHPLSAWETEGPAHIGHCWRKQDANARGEVIDAVWLPHSPEILGIYIEGVVFKWSPYDGETEELAVGAKRLALSRDGNLFATGDGKGTIKVFTTSGFGLLYQLVSQDTVFGIAFSPDLHRFYDIRGHYGNVWEPNVLAKFAEHTGASFDGESENESIAHTTSMSFRQDIDSITALVGSPNGRLYYCGTEKGAVRSHHTQQERSFELHASRGFLSIEQMSCSDDGRYICFSDSSRKIFIKSITPGIGHSAPSVENKAEITMKSIAKGPILHLVFRQDSSQLLVQASSSIHVISLESFEVTHSGKLDGMEQKWVLHPQDPSLIMGFGANVIRVLDWNLNEQKNYNYEVQLQKDLPDVPGTVERVLVTHNKKHVLVQLSRNGTGSQEKTLVYFDTSAFSLTTTSSSDPGQTNEPSKITPTILDRSLSSQVASALSFLVRDRLIFLSRTLSVCTWQIPSGPIHEIFSLPGDWINRDCLALCGVWGTEKSFLCPRNGEVAVVKCAALA